MAKKEVLDEETKKVNSINEEFIHMSQTKGWGLARELLFKKVATLMSIDTEVMNLPKENIMEVIAARKLAADILINWVREVDGTIEGAKGNKPIIDGIVEDFIVRELKEK